MRVNVYHEEMTDETKIVEVQPPNKPGKTYYGVRLFLRSAPELHATPADDDRSAVTFWFDTLEAAQDYFDHVVSHDIDLAIGRRKAGAA